MATQAALGTSALNSKDFASAIKHYTSALSEAPTSPDYYIKRSTAYQRSSPPEHEHALRDAEAAVYYAHKRGKRELIATAQIRRGIALFGLKRWRDAKKCFEWVKQRNAKEQGLAMWEMKVENELEKAGDDDNKGVEATVLEIPDIQSVREEGKRESATVNEGGETRTADGSETNLAGKTGGVQTPADKIRHEWYQTSENVVVTLFVKGVPKDQTTIDIREQSVSSVACPRWIDFSIDRPSQVSISFPMPNGSTYDFSLDPLFTAIDNKNSTSTIVSSKIELILKKSRPGQKWTSLESTQPIPANQDSPPSSETPTANPNSAPLLAPAPAPPAAKPKETAPSYPTSSRSGPKNWDKLATDLIKQSKKQEKPPTTKSSKEDDDYNDDDDDYEDDEVDPAHGFFKKLYANADPDTRRAMMKSYQESNGTALSTNWAEVGKGKVETSPPEGMEARRWNS